MRIMSIWNPWGMSKDMMGMSGMDMDSEYNMDVWEEGDNVMVKLKAPGFQKDQIDINIEPKQITITGKSEQQTEEEDKNRKYYRKEIEQRSFTRTAPLPTEVVPDRASAKYENGILMITLPKSGESKPKNVQIKAQ